MDLLEHLMQDVEAPEPEAPQGWQVDSPDKAEYAAWKIAMAQKVKAEKKAELDAWMERAKEWYAKETEEADRTINFFTEALQPYIRAEITSGKTKKKSIKFINGAKAGFTSQAPEFNYDEADLLAWAEANAPEFVTVPAPKLEWGKFKGELIVTTETIEDAEGKPTTCPVVVYKSTGERLDLIEAIPRPDKFSVNVKGVNV